MRIIRIKNVLALAVGGWWAWHDHTKHPGTSASHLAISAAVVIVIAGWVLGVIGEWLTGKES
ncbi:hypothetical protein KV557_24745 [Kitasatospora aureofaciens]|uniref:hypothetical protein n=1 Tax=Kitasatospora aureofaciens TaxID=1894 RepID=UPI001C470C7D|nr:hypothetical protein [Kitasatospora aureofaciens]MBV6700274.1 hypothetical protein [Kitasatospora aureofaciens]